MSQAPRLLYMALTANISRMGKTQDVVPVLEWFNFGQHSAFNRVENYADTLDTVMTLFF